MASGLRLRPIIEKDARWRITPPSDAGERHMPNWKTTDEHKVCVGLWRWEVLCWVRRQSEPGVQMLILAGVSTS